MQEKTPMYQYRGYVYVEKNFEHFELYIGSTTYHGSNHAWMRGIIDQVITRNQQTVAKLATKFAVLEN